MKNFYIKIDFDSDTVKTLSDRFNLLSWAVGGINFIGFNLQGFNKIATVTIGWLVLQYVSFALLKVSKTLKLEEKENGTN